MAEGATQDFLEIKDIKEGIVILKNNDMRGVLMVSSINFALKSEEDQGVIIYNFQRFLNSLDFFCQVVIQSRKINITPYLESLKELEQKQTNELLKIQTSSYTEFVKQLVQGDEVMTKTFYIVIPYALTEGLGTKGVMQQLGVSNLFGSKKEKTQQKEVDFEKCKTQLWQRMEFVAIGLQRCELESVPLTTPELIELFWSIHHPDQAEVGHSPEIVPELLK